MWVHRDPSLGHGEHGETRSSIATEITKHTEIGTERISGSHFCDLRDRRGQVFSVPHFVIFVISVANSLHVLRGSFLPTTSVRLKPDTTSVLPPAPPCSTAHPAPPC